MAGVTEPAAGADVSSRPRSGRLPTARVSLPSLLETATGGVREIAVSGRTLREALADLLAQEPRLRPHLFDETGGLREHVLCFHNGTNTRWLKDWEGALADGDAILFMQAVSGG